MKSNRYESVQVLRAIAALGVVVFHTVGNIETYGWTSHVSPPIARHGELGADVFFVISGFVIALISAGDPKGWPSARKFLLARIARVVPLYWVLTALFAILLEVAPSAFGHARLNPWHLFTSFLFLPSINWAGIVAPVVNVGQTLTYEAWFYVMFGAAICVTSRPLIAVGVLLGFTSLLSLGHGSGVLFAFYANPIVLEFVMGCLVGAYYAAGKRIRPSGAFIAVLSPFALKCLCAAAPTDANRFIVSALPALAVVVIALAFETRMSWGRLLGKLCHASYSLYLTHVLSVPLTLKIVQIADGQHRLSGDLLSVAAVIGSVIVAVGCYQLLKRPMSRSIRSWMARRADERGVGQQFGK